MTRPGLILLPPCTAQSNAYLKNLRATLALDFDLHAMGEARRKPWLLLGKIRILYVNWIENGATIFTWFQLVFLRLLGIRIIWAFHNKLPHHGTRLRWSRFFMRSLMRLSHAIIVHCHESEAYLTPWLRKVHYLPLGNYIGIYPPPRQNLRQLLEIPDKHLVFLCLGALKRYKNVELLLTAFQQLPDPDFHLLIAGRPESEDYGHQIRQLAGNDPRIHLKLGYVADEQIQEYLSAADLLAFPLERQSSLNSSAIILAFSHAKTVIAPRIGTLADYAGQPDFFYAYDYQTPAEHSVALLATLRRAGEDFRTNPDLFRQWGQIALDHVRRENDWTTIRPAMARICRAQ